MVVIRDKGSAEPCAGASDNVVPLSTRSGPNDVCVLLCTCYGGLGGRRAPSVIPQGCLPLQRSHGQPGLADPGCRVSSLGRGHFRPCRHWVLDVPGDGAAHLETVEVVVGHGCRRAIGASLHPSRKPEGCEEVGVGVGCTRRIATACGAVSSRGYIALDIGDVVPELACKHVFLFLDGECEGFELELATVVCAQPVEDLPTHPKVDLVGPFRRR